MFLFNMFFNTIKGQFYSSNSLIITQILNDSTFRGSRSLLHLYNATHLGRSIHYGSRRARRYRFLGLALIVFHFNSRDFIMTTHQDMVVYILLPSFMKKTTFFLAYVDLILLSNIVTIEYRPSKHTIPITRSNLQVASAHE